MLLCMTTLLNAFPLTTEAQKVVYDFENCPIGQKFTMWNVDRGNVTTSTAEVVVDPTNSNNKVLHVVLKDWGTFVTLTLPPELAGHQLTDKKQFVAFDLYRPSTDAAIHTKETVEHGNEARPMPCQKSAQPPATRLTSIWDSTTTIQNTI